MSIWSLVDVRTIFFSVGRIRPARTSVSGGPNYKAPPASYVVQTDVPVRNLQQRAALGAMPARRRRRRAAIDRPFPSTTRRRELRAAIKQFACSNFWRGWSITVQGRTSDGDLRDYAVPWGIAFSAVLLVQAFQHASRSRPTASRTSANDAPGAPCAPVCASSSIAVAVEDGACVTVTDLSPPARDRPARSAMGVDEAPRARLSRRGLKWDVT